jgi:hypothetical protein
MQLVNIMKVTILSLFIAVVISPGQAKSIIVPPQANEVISLQENEVISLQENEVTSLQENEVISLQENEVISLQENDVVSLQENNVISLQENKVISLQENEIPTPGVGMQDLLSLLEQVEKNTEEYIVSVVQIEEEAEEQKMREEAKREQVRKQQQLAELLDSAAKLLIQLEMNRFLRAVTLLYPYKNKQIQRILKDSDYSIMYTLVACFQSLLLGTVN